MIKNFLVLLVLVNAMQFGLKAQTIPSPTSAYINIELLNPQTLPNSVLDTLLDPMSILAATDTLKISITMMLADTNVIDKINIKLGTTLGGNDLLDQQFNYDDTNLTLPQHYKRRGKYLNIVLGEYLNSGVFYCEIILEDNIGNLSVINNYQSGQ